MHRKHTHGLMVAMLTAITAVTPAAGAAAASGTTRAHQLASLTPVARAQAQFCPKDNAANINGIRFNVNLDGGRKPCR